MTVQRFCGALVLLAGFFATTPASTAQKGPAAPPLELLYPVVEVMPQLPGGASSAQAIEEAIRSKLSYRPAKPVVPLKYYRAEVTFTIGPNGRVRAARVLTEQEEAFRKAVVAATNQLPRFTPGRKEGQPVPVRYTLSVGLTEPLEAHASSGGYRIPPDWPEVEKWVPQPPRLPTGQSLAEALYADFTRHPLPPQPAKTGPTTGIGARLSFTVDKTGCITDLLSAGTSDLAHDRAMVQALARLPRFEPGRDSEGQAVAVHLEEGISFPPPGAPAIPAAPLLPRQPAQSRQSKSVIVLMEEPKPKPFDPKKVYTYVEQMPQLPSGGGYQAIAKAIQTNVVLPASAGATCQGRVFISFVVRADGAVVKPNIVKGLASTCDAAVLTAVRQLPRFIPGMQNGEKVAVSVTIPIMLPVSAGP